MNQNNLNTKFGKCCNCPALSNGNQLFTNFESSRFYNNNLQKHLKLKDSHAYRLNLQTNATKYMANENSKYNTFACKSEKQNSFYIDTSSYNFSTKLINEYSYPLIQNNYIKKSEPSNY